MKKTIKKIKEYLVSTLSLEERGWHKYHEMGRKFMGKKYKPSRNSKYKNL